MISWIIPTCPIWKKSQKEFPLKLLHCGALEFHDEKGKKKEVNCRNFQLQSVKIENECLEEPRRRKSKNLLEFLKIKMEANLFIIKGFFEDKKVRIKVGFKMYMVFSSSVFEIFVHPFMLESKESYFDTNTPKFMADSHLSGIEKEQNEKTHLIGFTTSPFNCKSKEKNKEVRAQIEEPPKGKGLSPKFDDNSDMTHGEQLLKIDSAKYSEKNPSSSLRNTVNSEKNFLFRKLEKEREILEIHISKMNDLELQIKMLAGEANQNPKSAKTIENDVFRMPLAHQSKSLKSPSTPGVSIKKKNKKEKALIQNYRGLDNKKVIGGRTEDENMHLAVRNSSSSHYKSSISEQIRWVEESKNTSLVKPSQLANVFLGRNERFFCNLSSEENKEAELSPMSRQRSNKNESRETKSYPKSIFSSLTPPVQPRKVAMGPVFDWKLPRPRVLREEDFKEPNINDSSFVNPFPVNFSSSTIGMMTSNGNLTELMWNLQIDNLVSETSHFDWNIKNFSTLEAFFFLAFLTGDKKMIKSAKIDSQESSFFKGFPLEKGPIAIVQDLISKTAVNSAQACLKLFWNEVDDSELWFKLENDAEILENFYSIHEGCLSDYFALNEGAANMIFFSKFIRLAFQRLLMRSYPHENEKHFDEMSFLKVSFYLLSKRNEKSVLIFVLFMLVMTLQRNSLTIAKLFKVLNFSDLPFAQLMVSLCEESLAKMLNLGKIRENVLKETHKKLRKNGFYSGLIETHSCLLDFGRGQIIKASSKVQKVLKKSDLQNFLNFYLKQTDDKTPKNGIFKPKILVDDYHRTMAGNLSPRVWQKSLLRLLEIGIEAMQSLEKEKEIEEGNFQEKLASLNALPSILEFSWFFDEDFCALSQNYLAFLCFDLLFFELAYHLDFEWVFLQEKNYQIFKRLKSKYPNPNPGYWIYQLLEFKFEIMLGKSSSVFEKLAIFNQDRFMVPYQLVYTIEHIFFMVGSTLMGSIDFQLGIECMGEAKKVPKTIFSLKSEIDQQVNKLAV